MWIWLQKKHKRRFEKEFDDIKTEEIVLSGGTFKDSSEVKSYTDAIYNRIAEVDFSDKDAEYLVYNYGKQTDLILKKFDELTDENQQEKMIKAEVWFTVNYEMACTPTDFFMRRTGRLFFDKPSVDLYKNLVMTAFISHFKWGEKTAAKHLNELDEKISLASSFN